MGFREDVMSEFCLFGKSLSHSISPLIHKVIYRELGIKNLYSLMEFEYDDLNFYMDKLKKATIKGANVTIPYKVDVMEYVDFIDEDSKNIGSVNTLVNMGGRISAFNTDYYGIEETLKKYIRSNTRVLILGYGGAARPIITYLINSGVSKVYIASRQKRKDYGIIKFIDYSSIKDIEGDIIINTTPVGMYPNVNESPISNLGIDEGEVYKNFKIAFDLIYNPLETRFLKDAKKYGLISLNGLKMLVYQAIFACKYFLNTDFDKEFSEKIYSRVKEIIYSKKKIISFVGMPGGGKSTIGKLISKSLGYDYIDLDDFIEEFSGESIGYIFETYGEEYFRNLESRCLDILMSRKNMVISTGGGCILKSHNREILKKNSFVIYLDWDVENIVSSVDLSNRPLLRKDKARIYNIEKERKHLYEDVSDVIVDNNRCLDDIVTSCMEILNFLKIRL